jgi:hypothetical protein
MLTMLLGLAWAVPPTIAHQGRLLDADGAPRNGTVDLSFALYGAPSGGAAVWDELHEDVALSDGFYAVVLGEVDPFGAAVFDGSTRYLGVRVGAEPELGPRTPVLSVPYAARAGVAEALDGGPGVLRVLGSATQTTTVSQVGQSFTPIPGASVAVDVPAGVTVRLRANGTVAASGGTDTAVHCGIRFRVDDTPLGDSSWGDVIVGCRTGTGGSSSSPTGWWCPWSATRDVVLTPGPHTLSLDLTGWSGSSLPCRLEAAAYSSARLYVEAY